VSAAIPLLDRLLTLERLLRRLTPRRASGWYAGVDVDWIAATVRRCARRPRHMRRRACLRTSLLLYHFLRLAGHPAVFHVAVFPPSMDPKRLHAHCWVTVGNRCVSEPPGAGAAEMLAYGADAKTGTREAAPSWENAACEKKCRSGNQGWTPTSSCL